MSGPNPHPRGGDTVDTDAMLAAAAAVEGRVRGVGRAMARDILLPESHRPDDRLRAATVDMLRRTIGTVAHELREYADRLLRERGEPAVADALCRADGVADRLIEADMAGGALIDEILASTRLRLLADALPSEAPDDPESPSLLTRLAESPDRLTASAARGVLVADSRAVSSADVLLAGSDLTAEAHHRLVWQVAAVLRRSALPDSRAAMAALDSALAEAARRSLAAHDEGERPDAAAIRLAVALDAGGRGLADMLAEALGDRRPRLFVALLARALSLDFVCVRDLLFDRAGDGLWVAMRAADLPRETIARTGYLLSEADGGRDVEAFADRLDTIMAIAPREAVDTLFPLSLDGAYREAIAALGAGRAER